jgi:hypothetical protein
VRLDTLLLFFCLTHKLSLWYEQPGANIPECQRWYRFVYDGLRPIVRTDCWRWRERPASTEERKGVARNVRLRYARPLREELTLGSTDASLSGVDSDSRCVESPSVEQVARENLQRLIKVLERAQAEMEACPQADAALNEPEEAIVRQASLLLPRRYHHQVTGSRPLFIRRFAPLLARPRPNQSIHQHFGALLSLKAKCYLLLGMHQLAFDSYAPPLSRVFCADGLLRPLC